MVPILIIFFGYNMEIAVGSTMTAVVPAAIIASLFNLRDKSIDYLVGTLIQFPAVAGTVVGAFLVAFLPVFRLQVIFATFVVLIGSLMVVPHRLRTPPRHSGLMYSIRNIPTSFIRVNREHHLAYRINAGLVVIFGFFSGIMAGLFGIGGGFLQTPMMIKLFRIPPNVATSTSLFILVITSVTGSISHYLIGNVFWHRSLPLIIAFAVGALGGNIFKRYLTPRQSMETLIGIGLLLAGIGVAINLAVKSHFGFSF